MNKVYKEQLVIKENKLLKTLSKMLLLFSKELSRISDAISDLHAIAIFMDAVEKLGNVVAYKIMYKYHNKGEIYIEEKGKDNDINVITNTKSFDTLIDQEVNIKILDKKDHRYILPILPMKSTVKDYIILLKIQGKKGINGKFLKRYISIAANILIDKVNMLNEIEAKEDEIFFTRRIIEAFPFGIMACDLTDHVIMCNSNAELLLGIERREILGKKLIEALPYDLYRHISTCLADVLKQREAVDIEFDHNLGRDIHIKLGVSGSIIYDSNGARRGCLFFIRDVSLGEEVIKLRQLNEMKTQFIDIISHDLKNPIMGILSAVELVKMSGDNHDELVNESLKIIEDSAHRMELLINDLLEMARLERGDIFKDKADIVELVKTVVKEFEERSDIKHKIEVIYDDNIPTVFVDTTKIKEVISNLISNAIKYSPNSDKIIVKIENEENDSMVKVSVIDRGIGIPEDQIDLVWDKFYRIKTKETSNIEGTGLGLAIVKHIIEAHGGSVGVISKYKEGSIFYFRLPY